MSNEDQTLNQVVLIIYLDNDNYVSMLHKPNSLSELDLWVQAELCKPKYKGKDYDLFTLLAYKFSGVGVKDAEDNV